MFALILLACATPETETVHVDTQPEATPAAAWTHYGDPFTKDASTACKEITADPDKHVDQTVRVKGHVENVCQKAGCWMVVADDDGKYLRVTMKGHSFGVPTETKMGPETGADIEGVLIKKELDEKTLAHLKSEAAGSPEELAKQFAPKYEIVATSVAIQN